MANALAPKLFQNHHLVQSAKKDFWDIDNARRVEGSNLERPLMFIVLESLCPNDPQLGPLLNGPA